VLRQLIFSHGIGVGSRVLDAGCGQGALVDYFNELGIPTSGLDESQQNIVAARRLVPNAEFVCQAAERLTVLPEHEFDLVLVRELLPFQNSLLLPNSLLATANLMSCIRPGGHLVFLGDCSTDTLGETVGHTESCYHRHLAPFPGLPRTVRLSDGFRGSKVWARLLSRRPFPEFLMTSIQIPDTRISRFDWRRLAENNSPPADELCCSGSQLSHHQSSARQTAA